MKALRVSLLWFLLGFFVGELAHSLQMKLRDTTGPNPLKVTILDDGGAKLRVETKVVDKNGKEH